MSSTQSRSDWNSVRRGCRGESAGLREPGEGPCRRAGFDGRRVRELGRGEQKRGGHPARGCPRLFVLACQVGRASRHDLVTRGQEIDHGAAMRGGRPDGRRRGTQVDAAVTGLRWPPLALHRACPAIRRPRSGRPIRAHSWRWSVGTRNRNDRIFPCTRVNW
jgi:hypothetical protein